MQPSDFIHPEDAAALRQMESLPGFASFIKKVYSLGAENLLYGINMASSIRLSEKQLPHLYRHLPPICQRMGIPEPEFYLKMNPTPNAWTFGDTRVYITVTSSLVEMMSDEELDSVLAHECGHILCHHVLYYSVARMIQKGLDKLGLLGKMALPVEYALLYWSRKSELSADRAASIITSPEMVASVMARIAGGPQSLTSQVNMEEWAKQADEYDSIENNGVWNKALLLTEIASQDHPFSAVRVREILKWGKSEQYRIIKNGGVLSSSDSPKCPNCKREIDNGWKFCQYCGHELNK